MQTQRLWLAASALLIYVIFCLVPAGLQLRRRRAQARGNAEAGAAWVVTYASQTGSAEELATHTAAVLRQAGQRVHLCALGQLDQALLAASPRILFVVSTYGEGDAPDDAAAFVAGVMPGAPQLPQLTYALLALGDSSYSHYCGFGRALDRWLQSRGAQALAPRVEVDRGAAEAVRSWHRQLAGWLGMAEVAGWAAQPLSNWRLKARRLLNAGSAGAPVFHLELEPLDGGLPEWQAGDLVQLAPPDDAGHPRDYSIASLPADGGLELLVRLARRADGSEGAASGWLTQRLQPGDTVSLRLRRHANFRIDGNQRRPLILIGNGTGIAGLRAHLKARACERGRPASWLVFGERNAASDFLYENELLQWLNDGVLTRLDTAFSRDQAHKRYVQDCLRDAGALVREWVGQGAAIYVCGSLDGMAGGVEQTLVELLGRDGLDQLSRQGRYRRDVY